MWIVFFHIICKLRIAVPRVVSSYVALIRYEARLTGRIRGVRKIFTCFFCWPCRIYKRRLLLQKIFNLNRATNYLRDTVSLYKHLCVSELKNKK